MPLDPMYTPQVWPGMPQKLQETRTDSLLQPQRPCRLPTPASQISRL